MSDPEWPEAPPFATRLAHVIGRESVSAFARRSGVPESTLRTYLNGRSKPGLEAVNKIAVAANVSPYWLTTGMGSSSTDLVYSQGQRQGQQMGVAEPVAIFGGLGDDEVALLENYRSASNEGKKAIRAVGEALARDPSGHRAK